MKCLVERPAIRVKGATAGRYVYAVALGGNRRTRHGSPAATLRATLAMLGEVAAAAPVIETPPLGPSIRRFANTVALIRSDEEPPALLRRLKAIELLLGRRSGQRWGARPIDLDIVLWSGGRWRSAGLEVPHAAYRARRFVLAPLARIAPGWRDPVTGHTVRQSLSQVDRRRPAT